MQNVSYSSGPTSSFLRRKHLDFSLLWIAIGVLIVHLLGAWYALCISSPHSVKEKRQKVLVKTVQLNPRLQPLSLITEVDQKMPMMQDKEPILQPLPEQSGIAITEKELPIATPVKIEHTHPKPKATEASQVEPQKKMITEQPKKTTETLAKKSQAPKKEDQSIPLKKAPPLPTQTPQKNSSTTKIKAPQAPVKKSFESAKSPTKAESKKEPSAAEIAALETEIIKQKELKAAADAARVHQQELLTKAQQNVAKVGENRNKIDSSKVPSLGNTDIPKLLENLQIDSLSVGPSALTQLNTKEASYWDEIAQRLRLGLRLPDYGEVKIKLIILRSGKVDSVQIVSSESVKNKQYIERTVPTLIFPPFANQFGETSQYSFPITLNNDY